MKLFLHWDMEGTSGLFTREQTWYWEEGVRPAVAAEGRDLLRADVESANAAAFAAGVDEVIVCDTHHGGGNVELDKVRPDPRVTYLGRSVGERNGERRWMPGLDESVDGILLPGHHARAGTPNAFLPHTWTLDWVDFRINGQSVGEIGIEACFAGHWNIPFLLVQGDEAACAEVNAQYPWVVTAPVKRAVDENRCEGPDAASARALTAGKIAEAIARLRRGEMRPYRPALPMTVTIRMRSAEAAQRALQRPGVRRVDDLTVEARVERHCDVVRWINGTGLDMPAAGR